MKDLTSTERKDQEIILQPKQYSRIIRTHGPKQPNDNRKKMIAKVGGFFLVQLDLLQLEFHMLHERNCKTSPQEITIKEIKFKHN